MRETEVIDNIRVPMRHWLVKLSTKQVAFIMGMMSRDVISKNVFMDDVKTLYSTVDELNKKILMEKITN